MANISQIKLPDGATYDVKDKSGGNLYPVKGTQTAKTGAWTGTIDVPALYDGLTIAYYLPYAGDGNATLNLTLADGTTTTGAVNVYYTAGSRMTTHYGAGSTIILTYWSAGSISVAGTATTDNRWTHSDYDSTITYRLTDYYGYYKAYTVLYRYQICLSKDEQHVLPINTVSNNTATTKTLTTESFNPFGPIYYYNTTTTISADDTIGANTLSYQWLADLRYSFNTGTTLTAEKAVYLVATLGTGCSATLASDPISQTLPSTEDEKIYIYLGQTYDTYRIELSTKHPVYRYKNGALRVITADDVVTVNGHTVNSDVPSGAVFTDTTYTSANNSVTGISIADHGTTTITGVGSNTTSVIGVQSGTTTASKASGSNGTAPTLGTAFTVPNVTSAGSASNWVFENVTIPKAASSATTVPIKNSSATSIPNVTDVGSGTFTSGTFDGGSGSFEATVTNHKLSFSHTHTAATHGADTHTHVPPTLGTDISIIGVQSSTTSVTGVSGSVTGSHVKSGGNGSAPTLGTAFTIPNVTDVGSASTWSFTDVTVPIKNASATTVPIKNSSSTTVVTGKTHTITDNGHTHTLS